jgi:SAM-dependent methyltransferase
MYTDGTYLSKNPGWHEAGAEWKALQVLKLIAEQNLTPNSIVDVGCGTGGVLEVLARAMPGVRTVGYDPAHDAIGLVERSDRVELRVGRPEDIHEHYDLLVSLDVFEHVEDYIGFLRSLRPLADRFIFHIPLDVSAQTVSRESALLAARTNVGHLHYFTRGTALASLETAGFKVAADRLLLPSDAPGRLRRTRLANIPRIAGCVLSPALTARILGGFTLLVLASEQIEAAGGAKPLAAPGAALDRGLA